MLTAKLTWKMWIFRYSRESFSKSRRRGANLPVPAGMCEVDWHNPPRRLLVLWLTGEVEFETSDGDIRRLAAGSVVMAEDTTGRTHLASSSRGSAGRKTNP